MSYLNALVGNEPVFRFLARLQPVRKTWRLLSGFFARNINCDVVIG